MYSACSEGRLGLRSFPPHPPAFSPPLPLPFLPPPLCLLCECFLSTASVSLCTPIFSVTKFWNNVCVCVYFEQVEEDFSGRINFSEEMDLKSCWVQQLLFKQTPRRHGSFHDGPSACVPLSPMWSASVCQWMGREETANLHFSWLLERCIYF